MKNLPLECAGPTVRVQRKEQVDIPECAFVKDLVTWVGHAAVQDQRSGATRPGGIRNDG